MDLKDIVLMSIIVIGVVGLIAIPLGVILGIWNVVNWCIISKIIITDFIVLVVLVAVMSVILEMY